MGFRVEGKSHYASVLAGCESGMAIGPLCWAARWGGGRRPTPAPINSVSLSASIALA